MKKLATIIYCFYKEEVHQKLFIMLILCGSALMPLSVYLFRIFPGKELEWLYDISITMMSLVCFFMAMAMGSDAVTRERDRGTMYLYLTNPVSPEIFILGKLLGAMLMMLISMVLLLCVCLLMHLFIPGQIHGSLFAAWWLILFRNSILIMYGILGGMIFSRVTNILFMILVFTVGSLQNEIQGLYHRDHTSVFYKITSFFLYIFPDFTIFNKKDNVILNIAIPYQELASAIGVALIYCLVLFILSGIVHRSYHYPKTT